MAALVPVGAARADTFAPWLIAPLADTNVAPGGQFTYAIYISNGDQLRLDGTEAHLRVELAPGLSFAGGAAPLTGQIAGEIQRGSFSCTATVGGTTIECSGTPELMNGAEPNEQFYGRFYFYVDVDPSASGTLASSFEMEGAGPATTSKVDPVIVSPATAPFGFSAFDLGLLGKNGEAFTQAAGHQFAGESFVEFNTRDNPNPVIGPNDPVEDPKDVVAEFPPGLLGGTSHLAQCRMADLLAGGLEPTPTCLETAQVGLAYYRFGTGEWGTWPVFNMAPPPGVPARFAYNVKGTPVVIDAHVRSSGDYGVDLGAADVSQALQLVGSAVRFWGVPFDPAHDFQRPCRGVAFPRQNAPTCAVGEEPSAFQRMPTSCTAPGAGLPVTARTDSWQHPGVFDTTSFVTHQPPGYPLPTGPATFPVGYSGPEEWGAPAGVDGCADVPFEPTLKASLTTDRADSPSGLTVDLGLPTDCWESMPTAAEAEESLCQSDMKEAEVTLPKGITINPSAAGGLGACSPGQIGLITPVASAPIHFDEAPAACPNDSKIGTVKIETPLLGRHFDDIEGKPVLDPEGHPVLKPLEGSVYLAQQTHNPFGSLLSFYLVAEGSGVIIKQAGEIELGAGGQITTRFDEAPQQPFANIHVELFGGSRATLRTPAACGTYAAQATLTPWSGNGDVQRQSSVQISQGCNGGFDPKLAAGSENSLAGAYTPWHLRLSRADGSQELASLTLHEPPGMTGKLKGIPYCSDATLAAISGALGTGVAQDRSPSCPAASQVGTVTVGAGAGANPFYTESGRVYLAGPYKGAPVSIAAVTPAVAGPFDLGSVVVRNAVYVDRSSAELTVQSDPLPIELHGIPLDLRDVRVDLTRPDFILNPTSCEPQEFTSTITSAAGASANPSVPFQAAGCRRLGFKPSLRLILKGKTKRSGHPALKAVLTYPKHGAYANIARAQVGLPHSEFLDQGNIGAVCTQAQLASKSCPPDSIYGRAKVWTPLLDEPLEGPVYLGVGYGHALPDLVADLDGQIRVLLNGKVDTTRQQGLRNTFSTAPDAPVEKFVIELKGGKKQGLLENSENLCREPQRANATFVAHNGKVAVMHPRLQVSCPKGKRRHDRHGG